MESTPPQGLVDHGHGQHAPIEGNPQHPVMSQEMSHARGGPPEHAGVDNPLAPEHVVTMGGAEHAPHGGLQQVMHAGVPHSAAPLHAVMDQVPGHHAYKMEPGPHDTLAHGQGPLPPGMEQAALGPPGMTHGQGMSHGQGPPPPGMEHAAHAPLGMEHVAHGPPGMEHGQVLGHGQGPLPPGLEHAMHGPPGIEHAAHAPPGMEHAAQAQYHHQMQGQPPPPPASEMEVPHGHHQPPLPALPAQPPPGEALLQLAMQAEMGGHPVAMGQGQPMYDHNGQPVEQGMHPLAYGDAAESLARLRAAAAAGQPHHAMQAQHLGGPEQGGMPPGMAEAQAAAAEAGAMVPGSRKRKQCPSKNCGCPAQKQPCFGLPGMRPICCKSCKAPNMVNLVAAQCMCGKAQPNFGFPGDKPKHCNLCKEEGMTNLRAQRCVMCGLKRPNYGKPGSKTATHCAPCAKKEPQLGLVDVKNKKCACGLKQPKFGYPGDKVATHCAKCKLEGMRDIMNARCACGKHAPTFGTPGSRATHCASCREKGMIDVRKA